MIRIAVSGYYGFNNTGDEAILLSLISTLKTLAPGVKITAFSHHPGQTSQLYGIDAVNRWSPIGILSVLFRCDMLLSGGGGLLQDATGIRSVCYYLAVVLLAKMMGKPVIYYAQGVGPIRSHFGRWLTKLVSNRVELITVRDQPSREDFLAMGVDRPPIVVTADPVLAVNPAQISSESGIELLTSLRLKHQVADSLLSTMTATPEEQTAEKEVVDKKKLLGIVVRDWKGCRTFKSAVAGAADRLVRQGWEVIIIPFQFPLDYQASQDVASQMQESCHLVDTGLPVETLFSVLGQIDLVLGMRLHALVMASVMRTPCVGISYDPKVERYLELTHQPIAGTVEDLDTQMLYQKLVETWGQRQEIISRLDQVLVQLRQQAWETASLSLSVFYARSPQRRGEVDRSKASRPGKGKGIFH